MPAGTHPDLIRPVRAPREYSAAHQQHPWGPVRAARERTTAAATSQDWAKAAATFNEYVRHELDCNEHVR
jgi:hypothetical protein